MRSAIAYLDSMTDFPSCAACDAHGVYGPARTSFRQKLNLIRVALTQRCRTEQDWNLAELYIPFTGYAFDIPGKARLMRIAYTLKAIVCVVLGQKHDLYANINPGAVSVAEWNVESWSSMDFMGEAYDFSVLVVAHGWRNWSFDSYRDSTA